MTRRILFVTGSDTGVGKTVLTAALARFLGAQGVPNVALKPFCSGGRDDARLLQRAQQYRLSLNAINPWHYPDPLAPAIAAARAGRSVRLSAVLRHLRPFTRQYPLVLVEGAGGLLSPLTADADAAAVIARLDAEPLVVVPNRLGAINQTRLVLQALPEGPRRSARVVLMRQRRPDSSSASNLAYLTDLLHAGQVVEFPWLAPSVVRGEAPLPAQAKTALERLWAPLAAK